MSNSIGENGEGVTVKRPDDTSLVVLEIEIDIRGSRFASRGGAHEVLQAFEAFRQFFPTVDLQEPQETFSDAPAAPTTEQSPAPNVEQNEQQAGLTDNVPLPVFLSSKKLPRGNNVLALAITVWAKRYKLEDVVTQESIRNHWKNSKKKVPANLSRDLSAAAKEGWLERHANSTGTYSITSYGEAHFDAFAPADS